MNKVRIEGQFVTDKKYYDIDSAELIRAERRSTLITKTWFMIKLHRGELISLYEGNHRLFVNIANNFLDSAIQLYDEHGDLIMTYPWNGKFSGFNEGVKVDDYNNPIDENGKILNKVYIELKDGEIRMYNEYTQDALGQNNDLKTTDQSVKIYTIEGHLKFNGEKHINHDRIPLVKANTVRIIDSKYFSSMNNDENHYEKV